MNRKIYKILSGAKQGLIALVLAMSCGTTNSQSTYTLNYTGGIQTLTLFAGTYDVKMWGADGGNSGNSRAGIGGYSNGTLTLASTTTVYIVVGGTPLYTGSTGLQPGGYNGGGSGYANATGRAGGGATHMATATGTLGALSTNTTAVIMVAGGGGGDQNAGLIGHGGGSSGGGTYPGTQTGSSGGISGAFGQGGDITTSYGGGGGGGWYGGGGNQNNAGSGGSGYIGGVSNAVTSMSAQSGFVTKPISSGNGLVIITELCSINLYAAGVTNSINPVICAGQSFTLMTNAISNYSWSTGAVTSSLVVAPTTNTVYTLTATSPSNCTTSRTISVTVSAGLPVLSISNPSSNICPGRTVSLTASGAITYTWTNAGVVNGQTFVPASTAVYTVTGQNGCGTTVGTTTITVAPETVTASATNTLVCEGYQTTLTAMSALTNYTWTPVNQVGSLTIVTPMSTTMYTVTASDGTCTSTQTVMVTTKPTPMITTTQTLSNLCQGQSIQLSASGAGIGGTYMWTPGGAGLSISLSPNTSTAVTVAGTNSVGCTATAQQILIVGNAPPLNAAADMTLVCTGQQVVLTASGAGSYQWTNGPGSASYSINPTVAYGVYTVTGSHSTNSCTAARTIEIAAIIPNVAFSATLGVCEGGTTTLTASGAQGYNWNGFDVGTSGNYQITPPASGIYTLIATTSSLGLNCPSTHYASVTVHPNPTVSVVALKATICRGETHTLTASGAPNYSWSGSTGTGSMVMVNPTITTIYTVTGVDANNCSHTVLYSAKVIPCSGIAEVGLNSISVYPNPSNGEFVIVTNSDIILKIVNSLGQEVRLLDLSNNSHTALVKDLSGGVYFIVGENVQGRVSQKVVITK
jgi:hypothetical protein